MFTFKLTEAKFLRNCCWHNLIVFSNIWGDTGNNRRIVDFKYSCFYAKPIDMVSVDNIITFESISVKSVLCILKIYTSYKTASVQDKHLIIKILEIATQLLSNF